jgi:RNA polymerase sigma-70 factor (ECF subfamily)
VSDDFADFYAASFTKIERAARAFCGDGDVAYDSTQEAFARAFARWWRVRRTEHPEAWVTRTAVNLTKRHFKDRTRGEPTPPPTQPAATGERVDVLVALRSLPERQREAAVLHYIVDMPVIAVAHAMGLSDGAVKAHLHKARAAMRESLEVEHD